MLARSQESLRRRFVNKETTNDLMLEKCCLDRTLFPRSALTEFHKRLKRKKKCC